MKTGLIGILINRNTKLQVTILTLCVMQLFLLININNSLVYQFTEKNNSTNFNTQQYVSVGVIENLI